MIGDWLLRQERHTVWRMIAVFVLLEIAGLIWLVMWLLDQWGG